MSAGFQYVPGPGMTKLDEDTDGHSLAEFSPAMADFLDAVKAERERLDTQCPGRAKGMSREGTMQKVAAVPQPVFDYLTLVNGIEWCYNGGLLKWLRHHPEYRVGQTIVSPVNVK